MLMEMSFSMLMQVALKISIFESFTFGHVLDPTRMSKDPFQPQAFANGQPRKYSEPDCCHSMAKWGWTLIPAEQQLTLLMMLAGGTHAIIHRDLTWSRGAHSGHRLATRQAGFLPPFTAHALDLLHDQ